MKAVIKRTRPTWNQFPFTFDDMLNDWTSGSTAAFVPAVNIVENDDMYTIELAVPGFKKEDIEVVVEDQKLSISSDIEKEDAKDAKSYTRREFERKSFSRKFTLPKGEVDQNKVVAKYEDGVLLVELPKLDEVKPKPAKRLQIV